MIAHWIGLFFYTVEIRKMQNIISGQPMPH